MQYLALAADYDGTLASQGIVDKETLSALQRLLTSGRKLVLVTGRHMPDLKKVFSHLHLFHWVVAENGALLYEPSSHRERLLCAPPQPAFLSELRRRGVPFEIGKGIVAAREPHRESVQAAIRNLDLHLQIIGNKGAVMVLPVGIDKGTGLRAALAELGLSQQNTVGIGDAENDDALLAACGCGVAVDNALPFLKERADIVTRGRHGAGVSELIEKLLKDDLAECRPSLTHQ